MSQRHCVVCTEELPSEHSIYSFTCRACRDSERAVDRAHTFVAACATNFIDAQDDPALATELPHYVGALRKAVHELRAAEDEWARRRKRFLKPSPAPGDPGPPSPSETPGAGLSSSLAALS